MSTGETWNRLEHLPSIGLSFLHTWHSAVTLQAERIQAERINRLNALTDGYMFVLALREVLRAATMVADSLDSDDKEKCHEALAKFNNSVPDAKNARDILDHFDDYARGIGDLSHPNVKRTKRVPTHEAASEYAVSYEMGDEGLSLYFGTFEINVPTASLASTDLKNEIYAVVYNPADEEEAYASFGPPTPTNPAAVALAVYEILQQDSLSRRDLKNLRARVTPESKRSWGRHFDEARKALDGYAITNEPVYPCPGVAYMKLIPDPEQTLQARGMTVVPNAQFFTLQQRHDLGDQWYIHSVGDQVGPEDLPPVPPT